MVMQPRVRMTSYLFSAWLSHFVNSIHVYVTLRHLLIPDGQNSHIMLDVVHLAREVGLDIINSPSHISYF